MFTRMGDVRQCFSMGLTFHSLIEPAAIDPQERL